MKLLMYSQVIRVVSVQTVALWIVTQCFAAGGYQCFGDISCSYLQRIPRNRRQHVPPHDDRSFFPPTEKIKLSI
jgi:hypothetical protein